MDFIADKEIAVESPVEVIAVVQLQELELCLVAGGVGEVIVG